MGATLIPPRLADMGTTFFGADWRKPLTEALGVGLNEVIVWDEYPTMIPENLEDGLKSIGEMRVQEIQFMLAQMAETRLDRSMPNEANDEN